MTRAATAAGHAGLAGRQVFEEATKYALTTGIGSILSTRRCLLLATGQDKAAAMIEGPVSAVCPTSALQLHKQAAIVLDAVAASDLKLMGNCQAIHQGSAKSEFG